MKILETTIDFDEIKDNLEDISDLNRRMIHEVNQEWLHLIDYEDDSIFLEPTLFFYPMENKLKEQTIPLDQILCGYLKNPEQYESKIDIVADPNGFVLLPGYGCIKTKPGSQLQLVFDDGPVLLEDGKVIAQEKEAPIYIDHTDIKLCTHQPEILTNFSETTFREPVNQTAKQYQKIISKAYGILKEVSPVFARGLEMTTREICLFNGSNENSMAAFSYFGTAFLNTENQAHDEVFFIDDISHQCGHVLFYPIALELDKFLKVERSAALKQFTNIEYETRDVYGALHGLFTYTTIANALSECLRRDIFSGKQRAETIGRLGFYMSKFNYDLNSMNDKRILTNYGFQYYDMFRAGYELVMKAYGSLINDLQYHNQPYIFNYQKFMEANPHCV